MKTNFASGKKFFFNSRAAFLAALLVGAGASVCHAAPPLPPSPVGTTWDCVMSGSRDGLAYMVFAGNNTFSTYEILTPKAPAKPSTSGRNAGGGTGRTDGGSNPNTPAQQIFGSQLVTNGQWTFDIKGNIIGFFTETMEFSECTTNIVVTSETVTTNGITTTITTSNLVIDCPGLTNTISFTGKVVPGKRLTLVCSTPFGKLVYQGVPSVSLSNISGAWYGTKKTGNQSLIEFFSLAPSANPNIYDVLGSGPGYTYSGNAVLSAQKKLAIVLGTDPNNDIVRSVVGSFNQRNGTGNLQGWDQADGPLTNHINFNVTKQ